MAAAAAAESSSQKQQHRLLRTWNDVATRGHQRFCGTIPPGEQSLFMGFRLLSALDSAFNDYINGAESGPLRANPSSMPNLISQMNRAHTAGAYRALEYCNICQMMGRLIPLTTY